MNKVMANKAKTAKAAVKKLPKEVSVEAAAEAKLVAENGDHAQGGFSTNVVASDDNSGGSSGGSGISPVVILGGLAAAGGIAAAAAGGGGEKTIVQPVPTPVPAPTPAPVPAPTYAVAADKAAADEGTAIRFTISGTNAAGKVVSYQLTGSAATAADVSSPLTGTVTLDSNGKAYVDVVVSADKLTEGAEKLNLVLSGGEKVAADVTVNDTSLTPAPTAQTFTLTTSVDAVKDFTGTAADDTFNAPATNPTTGASATTINSGDAIDGGAGNDTLNITATATNNNSLTGLTVTAIETVNIAGGNYLGATSPALAAAQANKTATASALAAKQGESALAAQQASASTAVKGLANVSATGGEAAVVAASTASATTAPQLAAAAKYVAATHTTVTALTTAKTADLPAGVTAFTKAQYNAAATAALVAADGTAITGDGAASTRAGVLSTAAAAVSVAIGAAANSSDLVEAQLAAAAQKVVDVAAAAAANAVATDVTALVNITDAAFTALNTTAYTKAQLVAAATAALKNEYTGAALTADADIIARAGALDTYADAVVAISGDYTAAQLNAAAAAALKAADGSSLVTIGDDNAAILARATTLETLAGGIKTTADAATAAALAADIAAANSVTVALANVSNTSIAATQFADATQIWLSGDSSKTNVTGVAATQTIGLDGVTGLDSSIGFGATVTNGLIASKGAAGTLTVTGAAMTALSISGTGSAGLTLVDGSTTDTIKTINVNTTTGTVLDIAGTTAVTAVNSTGAGGLTLASAGVKVASVTTGEGADLIKVTTTTAADNAGTTIDETVNASVSTAGGNDVVVVAVTGDGKTSVNAGAGNDTVYLNGISTGANTVALGDGDDTLRIGAISTLASTKVDGGTGTDTLVTSTTSFGLNEYTVLAANVVGVETVKFSAAVTALDASKTGFTNFQFNAGANTVTEVSSAQSITLARQAAVTGTTGFTSDIAETRPTGLTAASKGYVLDTDLVAAGNQTAYGDNLTITASQVAANSALLLSANKATVSVTAQATTSTTVVGQNSSVSVAGDLKALDVTLASVRGSGTTYGADEWIAGATVNVVAGGSLAALETIKVGGSGSVTINAGTAAATAAKLASIDLSGMTAFADQNVLGQQVNGATVGGYDNKSVSSVTLNDNVSETVLLGGARDTVVTGSTVIKTDTITGFQVTASAADPLVVDLTRSDVLKIGTAFSVANAAKMTTTATSLEGALLEAASFTVGGVAKDNVVFQFGGNTYVYVDAGANNTVDNADTLVKLTGTLNLDLLLQSGVVIA